jgi:hypothetical protein
MWKKKIALELKINNFPVAWTAPNNFIITENFVQVKNIETYILNEDGVSQFTV